MTKRKTKDDATGITVQHIPVKQKRSKFEVRVVYNQMAGCFYFLWTSKDQSRHGKRSKARRKACEATI